jgi:hypothetical protein
MVPPTDIRKIDFLKVPLKDLHYQYIHNYTPIKLWNYDMSLPNSPHVELLRLIKEDGFNWKRIWQTRYVEERIGRRKLGMKQWTDEHIKKHIRNRWATYKSLKKYGYKKKLHRTKKGRNYPIRVLLEPFWKTRFGIGRPWLCGFELWDGGGRSCAAHVLGWDSIPAEICEDTKPGTNDKGHFKDKLRKVKGIWQ